jgi:hypothetical protein
VADAPAAEEEEVKESGGEPGTPPVEEVPPAAPEAKAEPEKAPEVKEPEAKAPLPPVKTKEEAKPVEAKKEEPAPAKKDDHDHHRDDCHNGGHSKHGSRHDGDARVCRTAHGGIA